MNGHANDNPVGNHPAALIDEHRLRRLLEGDGTALSYMARAGLFLPGKAYGLVMFLRRKAYDAGLFASHASGLPTVSIGNITAGGSGKTPTVALLANRLHRLGHRPGILMRGYAKTPEGESDEAVLYTTLAPEAILAVNPDRRAGALAAKSAGASILLMDDGFQHRRLKRDLDIVLIDATSPWGGGNTLPGGLLREPVAVLKAADAVLITRSDQVDAQRLAAIASRINRLAPHAFLSTARHSAARFHDVRKTPQCLDSLRGRNVVVLSGIARPEAFVKTLRQLGAVPQSVFAKPDHHPLDRAFVLRAVRAAEEHDALAVTTEKDFAKPVFHHFQDETADKNNSVPPRDALSEQELSRLRVLGVDQTIQNLDGLLDRILKIAPIGRTPPVE